MNPFVKFIIKISILERTLRDKDPFAISTFLVGFMLDIIYLISPPMKIQVESMREEYFWKEKIMTDFCLTDTAFKKIKSFLTQYYNRSNAWIYEKKANYYLEAKEQQVLGLLKDKGLTAKHLQVRSGILFRDTHLDALVILVTQRGFTVKDALWDLDLLNKEQASLIQKGFSKEEVIDKTTDQLKQLTHDWALRQNEFLDRLLEAKTEFVALRLLNQFTTQYSLKHFKDVLGPRDIYSFYEKIAQTVMFFLDKESYDKLILNLIKLGISFTYQSPRETNFTPLLKACKKNKIIIVKHLIEQSAEIFSGDTYGRTALMLTSSSTIARFLLDKAKSVEKLKDLLEAKTIQGLTPLMIAAGDNNLEVIKVLLEYEIDILAKNSLGANALHLAKTPEICQLLIDKARKQEKLWQFITAKDSFGNTAFDHFTTTASISNIEAIFPHVMQCRHFMDLQYSLQKIWKILFTTDKDVAFFKSLYVEVSSQVPVTDIKTFYIENNNAKFLVELVSLADAYQKLYGENYDHYSIKNKVETIKYVIAEIFCLFRNPERCLDCLEYLSDRFLYFYETAYGKKFPEFDSATYEFRKMLGYIYPAPKRPEEYSSLISSEALTAFLVSFLREYGLAEEVYEAIGFIPSHIADPLVRDGFHLRENKFIDFFHGKDLHGLQIAMAIVYLYIKNKGHSLKFENGEINMLEVLQALIDTKHSEARTLWEFIFDSAPNEIVAFTGPRTGLSFYTRYGQLSIAKKKHPIALCLADNFCKDLLALFGVYRNVLQYKNMDWHSFLSYLNDMRINYVATEQFDKAINYALGKKYPCEVDRKNGYALVNKTFKYDKMLFLANLSLLPQEQRSVMLLVLLYFAKKQDFLQGNAEASTKALINKPLIFYSSIQKPESNFGNCEDTGFVSASLKVSSLNVN